MITDATFEIDGAVFYAPTGGNPEGAAARLSKMIQCSQNVSPATEFDGGVDIEKQAGGLDGFCSRLLMMPRRANTATITKRLTDILSTQRLAA